MDKYPSSKKVHYKHNQPLEIFREIEGICLKGTWSKPPQCKGKLSSSTIFVREVN
jgi:hypothetical protein